MLFFLIFWFLTYTFFKFCFLLEILERGWSEPLFVSFLCLVSQFHSHSNIRYCSPELLFTASNTFHIYLLSMVSKRALKSNRSFSFYRSFFRFTWQQQIFNKKNKQLGLQFPKHYHFGPRSKLSLANKILIYSQFGRRSQKLDTIAFRISEHF